MLVPSRQAAKELGVHPNTLRKWARESKIKFVRTAYGQRRYDCSSVAGAVPGARVCYCRVSSAKQRDDLERQVAFMRNRYPQHEIIEDIGSGLNFKRKGLLAILERASQGGIAEVVVAHRDRLCRFGIELVRWLVERNGGRLVVLDSVAQSPQAELVTDLISIIHVFACRAHGLRKYGRAIKEDSLLSDSGATAPVATVARHGKVRVQQDN